ncbi:GNAT family N-acetyltransferase [Nocardioides zhouii]|uniref:GNAT family N-acetyltransferase n=1 Tax=Nocardioides zhouii TaxID=1168729 RepID=A0A4Q2SIN0_9ACTN|nr:GNAT family N-acetyltransferase [Nocardioides zhouii]RYC05232.1 GNAT family N-acetyltransferase [Nocardioides zhouii]
MSQQPDVEIRSASAADTAGIDAVIRAAFGAADPAHGDQVGDLWSDVRAGEHLLAERVAVVEGEVVGHVGISHCWIDARRELVAACMLSPLSTSPAHQERGIGTALVAAAIHAARGLGRPALFLEGSPSFYSARCFEPAATYGIEAPTTRVPPPAFQVVPFALEEWMTGRVVYPEVWWRHDSTGLRDPDLADVEAALGLA